MANAGIRTTFTYCKVGEQWKEQLEASYESRVQGGSDSQTAFKVEGFERHFSHNFNEFAGGFATLFIVNNLKNWKFSE